MNEKGQHLSHSQISCLLKCPRQYYYRYIEDIRTPATHSLLMGSCYHAALERNFLDKVKTGKDLEAQVILDAYDKAWTQRVSNEEIDWQDQSPGAVKDKGAGLVALYMAEGAPFVMPVEVERKFSVHLPGLVPKLWFHQIHRVSGSGAVADQFAWQRAGCCVQQTQVLLIGVVIPLDSHRVVSFRWTRL